MKIRYALTVLCLGLTAAACKRSVTTESSTTGRLDPGDVVPDRFSNPDSMTANDIRRLNEEYATRPNPNRDADFQRALGGILSLYAIPLSFIPGVSEGMTAMAAIDALRKGNIPMASAMGALLFFEVLDITGLGDNLMRSIAAGFQRGAKSQAATAMAKLGSTSPTLKEAIAEGAAEAIKKGGATGDDVGRLAGTRMAAGDAAGVRDLLHLRAFTNNGGWLNLAGDISTARKTGLFKYTGTADRVCNGSARELVPFLKSRGLQEVQAVHNIEHTLVRFKEAERWVYVDGTYRQFIRGASGPEIFVGDEAAFRALFNHLPLDTGTIAKADWINGFFKLEPMRF